VEVEKSRKVDRLIDEWEVFIASVERGYTFCSAEYDNDSWHRRDIEDRMADLTEAQKQRLTKADEKYRSLTRIRKRFAGDDLEIVNRVPLNPVGEMAEDIASLDM